MNKKNFFAIWSALGAFALGIFLTYMYFHFSTENENTLIDNKIRFGEILTWLIWICLYFGTPFFLKRYVDDEREVKKMVIGEIDLSIKQSDAIAAIVYKIKSKNVDAETRDLILVNFEILERYVNYTNEQIKTCIKNWESSHLENFYFKYKDIVTTPISKADFVVDETFYSKQLLILSNFQQFLKEKKIEIMRS